jgi:hypothetical protein
MAETRTPRDAPCLTHGRTIYEHTPDAMRQCFGFVPCPDCHGECLIDRRSLCATCGACGVVVAPAYSTPSSEGRTP